jgi:hypothetical protein
MFRANKQRYRIERTRAALRSGTSPWGRGGEEEEEEEEVGRREESEEANTKRK